MKRGTLGAVALAAAIGAGAIACGDDGGTTEVTTGTVSGSVSTQVEAVAGATVTLTGGRTATTNATGGYSFSNVEAGSYTVTLTLPEGMELPAGETLEKSVTVTGGGTASASWTLHDPDAATVVEVRLSGITFSPANITISPNTIVRWTVDEGTHSITPEDSEQAGVWNDTGLISTGTVFEHKFETANQVYDYFCSPHQSQGMVGSVTVTN